MCAEPFLSPRLRSQPLPDLSKGTLYVRGSRGEKWWGGTVQRARVAKTTGTEPPGHIGIGELSRGKGQTEGRGEAQGGGPVGIQPRGRGWRAHRVSRRDLESVPGPQRQSDLGRAVCGNSGETKLMEGRRI